MLNYTILSTGFNKSGRYFYSEKKDNISKQQNDMGVREFLGDLQTMHQH